MIRTARSLAVAGISFLLLAAHQEGSKQAETDERCAVFLTELEEGDESSVEVMEEVQREIKRKKEWFRLVEDEIDADISIELKEFGNADEVKADIERTEGSTGGSATLNRPALLDLRSGYFIEFQMTVTEQFRTTMTVTGRGRGLAARNLAQKVHTICETYSE